MTERLPRSWQKNKLNLILSNTELDDLEKYAAKVYKKDLNTIAKPGYGEYLLQKIREART